MVGKTKTSGKSKMAGASKKKKVAPRLRRASGPMKVTYRETFRKYFSGRFKLEKWQWVGVILLVVVLSGFAGWVWEFMLQEVKGGFQHLFIKGGNLLPWLNIYAYGAVVAIPLVYKLRRKPWAVFIVAGLAMGVVELIGGWLAYTLYDGARYWDYSNKWWGIGNINGFVCPVSAAIFGVGALLLMYVLLPFCMYVARRMTKRAFLTLTITLFTLVMVDDLTNLTLKNLGMPTAMDLYHNMGWEYMNKG